MKSTARILVCEDDAVVALVLEECLRNMGHDVCAIERDGDSALAQAIVQKPDLVMMDISLAGSVDGIEAALKIRRQIDAAVVFLTSSADEETIGRARAAQPASYVLKPFKERELRICLEIALANHALQRELREAHAELERRVRDRTASLAATNVAMRAEMSVRREAEEQARERAALLDLAQDAILVRALDDRLLYWNRGAERLYGYTRDEIQRRSVSELLGEDGDNAAHEARKAALATGAWKGDLHHVARDGTELIVQSRWTLVSAADDEPQSFLVVNTDVTEARRIQAQFLRAQRLENIGALASGIAHDLNNVFTPLLLSAQMMRDASSERQAALVDSIVECTRRGAGLVRQILVFVRGGESERAPLQLEPLCRDVERLLRQTLPRSIEIVSRFGAALPSVLGHATQMHQVLMNLCVNARDAMPDGGRLVLSLDACQLDEAFASSQGDARPGAFLRISIEDSGTGMTPEVKSRMFEPFFTTKPQGVGTGLGLATVREILRAHEGFIDVSSEVGRGTRFDIYLPATSSPASEECGEVEASPRAGEGELVLVADDEHAVREIIRAILEAGGYRVIVADGGPAAVSQFALHSDDVALVLTDVGMPRIDGCSVLRAIRAIDGEVPISVMSTGENAADCCERTPAGEVGYLQKPFTRDGLLRFVADMLAASQPRTRRARPAARGTSGVDSGRTSSPEYAGLFSI